MPFFSEAKEGKSSLSMLRLGSWGGDIILGVFALLLCTILGYIFHMFKLSEANIITVYVLGILITAVLTRHAVVWITSAIAGIFLFNCLYAVPRFTFTYYDPQYFITTALMLITSLLLGSISEQHRRRMQKESDLLLKAESERMRANLLRSIGHDLRTPLTGISGDAEILLSHGESMSAETRRQLYQNILDDSEWLINVVGNLLYITRMENQSLDLPRDSELLSELVQEALKHSSKRRSEHSLELNLAEDLILISCDAHLLVQAISNIINNAISHTPKDSHIVISTRMEGDLALLEIADDGPGLGADSAHAFEMFYSNAKTNQRRGMGLGLALCKTIIEAHNGQIYYRENTPHGAVFGLVLPGERIESE